MASSSVFSLPHLLRHSVIIAAALLTCSCSRVQRGGAAVLSDDAPVYSQMSATGGVKAILHKGQTIVSHPTIAAASECWLNITGGCSKPDL